MIRIEYARAGAAKGRITLGISVEGEARAYSVLESVYFSIGAPPRGAELTPREHARLQRDDGEYRAMKKAVTLLAVSDKSAATLRQKLLLAGFDREIADTAVEACVSRGYLDEGRQLDRLVVKEANFSLRGRAYVKRKLLSKGYRGGDIDAAIDRMVADGEIDFRANFLRLAEKKGATDSEARRALKYKYGYIGEDYLE